jgi:hypothetical protein
MVACPPQYKAVVKMSPPVIEEPVVEEAVAGVVEEGGGEGEQGSNADH